MTFSEGGIQTNFGALISNFLGLAKPDAGTNLVLGTKNPRSTSKIVEWEKKKRAKRIKNVLQCPM